MTDTDHTSTTDASVPAWLLESWLTEQPGTPGPDALNDTARLAAVAALGADDVEHVQPLTADLLASVSAGTGAPIGLLNVVLSSAQVIAGAHGLTGWLAEARATPAEWSLCATVVRTGEAYVVPDLAADAATAENPLHLVDGIHAYAGVPLRTRDGQVIGAVCALDTRPRQFTEDDLAALRRAADEAMDRLEGGATA